MTRIGQPTAAVPTLIRFLRDRDDEVREEVAFALGEIGDSAKTAIPALQQSAQQDGSVVVREAAQEAIEKIQEDSEDEAPRAGARPQPGQPGRPLPTRPQ